MSDDEDNVFFFDRRHIGDDKLYAISGFANSIEAYPSAYPDLVDETWFSKMKFCGCGDPEGVKAWLLAVLEALQRRSESGWKDNQVEETVLKAPNDLLYFVFYTLDAMGLLEHGGNVRGSWLTEEGKELLSMLRTDQQLNQANSTQAE